MNDVVKVVYLDPHADVFRHCGACNYSTRSVRGKKPHQLQQMFCGNCGSFVGSINPGNGTSNAVNSAVQKKKTVDDLFN